MFGIFIFLTIVSVVLTVLSQTAGDVLHTKIRVTETKQQAVADGPWRAHVSRDPAV